VPNFDPMLTTDARAPRAAADERRSPVALADVLDRDPEKAIRFRGSPSEAADALRVLAAVAAVLAGRGLSAVVYVKPAGDAVFAQVRIA